MRLLLSVVLLLFSLTLSTPSLGTTEFRGLWVDAWHPGLKTHDEVTRMVKWAQDMHFNALLVQVRRRADAYYTSNLEPRAPDVAPEYDPLTDIIVQGHNAGLEIHAWLSVYEVANDSKWCKPGPTHIYTTHPEWLMTSQNGKRVFPEGRIFVDPGVPAVRDHIVSVVLDIVKNYAVDGIHLDNIAYPEKDAGYNPTSVERFNGETGGEGAPEWNDPAWTKWRAEQVTDLVVKIHSAIQSTKPSVKLSAAVRFSEPILAAEHVMQDWDSWTRRKIVDFVIPLAFAYPPQNAAPKPAELLRSSYERRVYVGVGAWNLSRDLAELQIEAARAAGAEGFALFSYHYLGPDSPSDSCVKGNDLLSSVFSDVASIPRLPWKQ